MFKITDIDLSHIRDLVESCELQGALNELLSYVNQDNYSQLPQILEGIVELQKKGINLSREQLEELKPFIDDFDENIQYLTVNIYLNSVSKGIKSTEKDLRMILSKTDNLELEVREHVISFLMEAYYALIDGGNNLITGLMKNLTDESWNIRKEIIHFLDELLISKPEFIKGFDDQLNVLYEEKDVDVKREALDFLLRLYINTYTEADIRRLIEIIPQKEWNIQEKIIFLIGELGVHRRDLIRSVGNDLLKLLDSHDYLVSDAIKEMIKKIMSIHITIFDDSFFEIIEKNEIDNIGAIEELLKFSITNKGFDRFYGLFNYVDIDSKSMIQIFNRLIDKINATNSELVDSLISNLTKELLGKLSFTNYLKLKSLLTANPRYNVLLNCFQVLNGIDLIVNKEFERRRKRLLDYLLKQKPELNFSRIKQWLDMELISRPIKVSEISNQFNIDKPKIKIYLENLIETGELNAKISDNTIERRVIPLHEVNQGKDLLFLKKWKILEDLDIMRHKIQLLVQVKNISSQQINNLRIEWEYNAEILDLTLKDQILPISVLDPEDSFILTYLLQKSGEKADSNPIKTNIKIKFIYNKNERKKIHKSLKLVLT